MKIKLLLLTGLITFGLNNSFALVRQNQINKNSQLDQSLSHKKNFTEKIKFKDFIEILYKKYQINIAINQNEVNDLLVDASILDIPQDKIAMSIGNFLAEHSYDFKEVSEKQYIVYINRKSLSEVGALFKISGIVRDELGVTIPGVTVRISRTKRGTTTDNNGKYTIGVEPTDTLVFSFVGYKKQLVSVQNSIEINVTLEPEKGSIQEVVIVGYGLQKKASLVGSQSTIDPKELRLPVGDITTLLAGRLAGVVATQRSGAPGQDAASLLIRGVATFSSAPQGPLLVVDGVPDRTINNIDPEDIESFTVLKDASATAVYGTRGANGVILINTKKGKAGKPQISAEADQGLTSFTQLPKFVDGPTYMNLYNEALTTRGRNAVYSQSDIENTIKGSDPDLYPNVNWYNQLFKKFGNNERFTLNVNGGSENANYYVSVGYYGETGLYRTDQTQSYNSTLKSDRFNFISNTSANLTKTTKMDFGINGYITNANQPSAGINQIFNYAVSTPSVAMPPRYSNGQWPQPQNFTGSPLMYLTESGYTNAYTNSVRSNLRFTQDLDVLTKGLSLTAMFAFDVIRITTLRGQEACKLITYRIEITPETLTGT